MSEAKNDTYRTDFWVDMHKPENHEKIARFVEDFAIDAGGDEWQLDAIMMLCEAFKMAVRDFPGNVEDLAYDFQRECFKHTRAYEQAGDAYLDYLKKGVRDYRDEHDAREHDKIVMAMAGYLSQEPAKRQERQAEWEREAAERKSAEKEAKQEAKPAPRVRTDEDHYWDLALCFERILKNPKTPVDLWNRISDEITDMVSKAGIGVLPTFDVNTLVEAFKTHNERTAEVEEVADAKG